ncbi:uncharacterized protein LOC128612177 isoform X2 [Ictalurus furcatus]|uniref:uncharacterized protein LOC128612177 isoform X2 n=1 Tax=Ictalurus furcatus TaxID=66913 RepID=UPI0023500DD5|nr:uncharacterized protein LOC128612177 isoform X2 [Ictalurus furcatus]
MHVTILKRGQEAPVEQCTTCCSHLKYHCPFCTSEVYHPNELLHVKNHVFNHLSLAVKHKDFIIVKCNLHCRDQAHFHCCYCATTVLRKVQIIKHLTACRKRSSVSSQWPCTDSTFDTEPLAAREPVSITEPASVTEPVSITEPASVTEPVSITEPASVTEPVSNTELEFITEQVFISEPASITRLAFSTEPVSVIELVSVTEPVSVTKLVSSTKSASLATHVHVQKKVRCTHCGITVNKKNLDMHIRRKHSLKMHVTILKRDQEAPVERCTTCCSNLKYHCPFCTSEVYHPNELHHVKNHVFNHLSLAVKHEDFIIIKCNLHCRDQAHFHCCYCTATVIRKVQIIKHLTACRRRSSTPSPWPCTESTFDTEPIASEPVSSKEAASITGPVFIKEPASVTEPLSITEPPSVPKPVSVTEPVSVNKVVSITKSASLAKHVHMQKKVQCTRCGITVNKKNLDMHNRRKHSLKMHVTVLKRGQEAPVERCTTCCSNLRYHCPFCTSEVYHPNELHHVKNHVFNHLSLAVKHKNFIIVKCNLSCRDQAHFHCCYCTTTVIRKVQIIKHLTACQRRSARPSPSPPPCLSKAFTFVTEPSSATELVYITEPESITKSALLAKQKKVRCTHCGITVNKKNLDVHIRRKHSLKVNGVR